MALIIYVYQNILLIKINSSIPAHLYLATKYTLSIGCVTGVRKRVGWFVWFVNPILALKPPYYVFLGVYKVLASGGNLIKKIVASRKKE